MPHHHRYPLGDPAPDRPRFLSPDDGGSTGPHDRESFRLHPHPSFRDLHRAAIVLVAALAAAASLTLLPAAAASTIRAPRHTREDEERNHERRREWIQSLHQAAPGIDWPALEEANWRAHFLERQANLDRGLRTDLWTEVGSANLAGRTHVVVPGPDGREGILLGSANGGVWSGTRSGVHWTPKSDAVGYASEHLVAVPGSPEVWVTAAGARVHATVNRGLSWFVPGGLPQTIYSVTKLLRDPGTRKVYALIHGVNDGLWKYWVCRSDDGGVNFSLVSSFPADATSDLWMSRTTTGPLYAFYRQYCLRSTDFGVTWTTVGSTASPTDQAVLMGSEAGAPTLYLAASVSNQWRLYRSLDAGGTWQLRSSISDFFGTLGTSIQNPDLVFTGGLEAFRSTDGGSSWTCMNSWWEYYDLPDSKLHADIFGLDCWMQSGQEVFYFDTDGGSYVSTDAGLTVNNISEQTLNISQYYGILTSVNDPGLVAAGAQDQGWQNSNPGLGGPPYQFTQVISGDYGHPTSSTHTLNMVYSVYPGFTLLQENETGPPVLQLIDFPPETQGVTWMPFILADPDDPDVYYFCARHIWRCRRISGADYAETMMPYDFGVGQGVTALAISPVDHQYWYAVTNQGYCHTSTDGGANWTLSEDVGPGAHYFYGTAIVASPTDRHTCWIGGSGYSNPAVWTTADAGEHWAPVGSGLPPTLVFGLDLDAHDTLYAAAEAGPYAFDPATGQWRDLLGTEAPLTTYWDVEYVPARDVVRFATYGRGIWDYAVPDPAAVAEAVGARPALAMQPNPARDRTTVDFSLRQAGAVTLELFDVQGRRVSDPVGGEFSSGAHRLEVPLHDARGARLSRGVYLVRLGSLEGSAVQALRVVD